MQWQSFADQTGVSGALGYKNTQGQTQSETVAQ
jgi:hypothetical protein